jgi:hypothetical protein
MELHGPDSIAYTPKHGACQGPRLHTLGGFTPWRPPTVEPTRPGFPVPTPACSGHTKAVRTNGVQPRKCPETRLAARARTEIGRNHT